MKRVRIFFAALLVAAALSFSSCMIDSSTADAKEKHRTAYIYSVTGEPLDTIYNVKEAHGRAPYVIITTTDGERVTLDNTSIIIK
jgi:hypothetical protein